MIDRSQKLVQFICENECFRCEITIDCSMFSGGKNFEKDFKIPDSRNLPRQLLAMVICSADSAQHLGGLLLS